MNYKEDVKPSDSPTEAVNKIINAREAGEVVVLVGDCMVHYDGRAWSYTEGRHSVTINPSGSVVIHHADSVKPKNWQPKGAETEVHIDADDDIMVESTRTNPDEYLSVRFENLIKSIHYNPSGKSLDLKGSEKEIHKYIYNNPDVISSDFRPQEMEKSVKSGDIDIFGSNGDTEPVIVEVKRKKAQQEDVGQVSRYVDMFDEPVEAYLVAPDITKPAKKVLKNQYGFSFVEVKPEDAIDQ